MDTPTTYDVIIVGAGPAGLCFARAMSALRRSVLILEQQPLAAIADPAPDGRDIALTHHSRSLLAQFGVWHHIPPAAISTIRKAQVFNGNSARPMTLADTQRDTLAYIVANQCIRAAVYAAVKDDPRITIRPGSSLAGVRQDTASATVLLADGTSLTCKLLVAADSRFSSTRKNVGISASMRDFGKTMLVCQMAHALPHHGVAHECFLQEATLAVLPLNGNRSSVVLTLPPQEAQRMKTLPEDAFNRYITNLFDQRLGAMQIEGGRYDYPLVAVYADRFVGPRVALIGDAAVGMHPVTAHGFNFSLRGQQTLAECMEQALASQRDIGEAEVLKRYESLHRRATRPLYLATNGIVSLYTDARPRARFAREFLLRTADRILPVNHFLVHKLMEDTPMHSSALATKSSS